ncbi:carboxypeptidase-like regulatory domain-containing protein [Pontibacter sp. 13R65]|uniref:carboxypeptidase-like regulatory domain-containing protein n=1 Tax=Pontibacter sp. 13R65 TaxID=3127458 RepID=UPI00301C559A
MAQQTIRVEWKQSKKGALLMRLIKGKTLLVMSFLLAYLLLLPGKSQATATAPPSHLLAALLHGTILDKASKEVIPYASVAVVGSGSAVQAGASGKFSIRLEADGEKKSIRVSSVGYISSDFPIADLLKQQEHEGSIRLYLAPKHESLSEVEVKARSGKWKARKVGYHIDEGTTFHHEISPSDTIPEGRHGQELGTLIRLKKGPATLQSVSFGLTGSGVAKLEVGIRLYSIQNNLPHLSLLPEPVVVAIPPHHTGWITVNLEKYNLTLQEDVAFVIEWLTETNKLNNSSLMGFSTMPKDQVTYYRDSAQKPWQILKSTLLSIRSYGMYVTLLYQK